MKRTPITTLSCSLSLLALSGCATLPSGTDSPKQLVQQAAPATALVVQRYSATLAVPVYTLNRTALRTAATAALLENETVAASPGKTLAQKLAALSEDDRAGLARGLERWLEESLADEEVSQEFLKRAGVRKEPQTAQSTGSGFFVSAKGHLLTNAHVVEADWDELAEEWRGSSDMASEVACELVTEVEEMVDDMGLPLEDNSHEALEGTLQTWLGEAATLTTRKVQREVRLVRNGQLVRCACKLIKTGKKETEDVALLQIQGSDLPALALCPSPPQAGEPLYLLGYSAEGFSEAFDTRLPTPTVTQGMVSNLRTLRTGSPVIQTDARMAHGNSGGPALNSQGQVIGIASFSVDAEENPGANFIVPASVLSHFVSEAGVRLPVTQTTPSTLPERLDAWEDADWLTLAKARGEQARRWTTRHPRLSLVLLAGTLLLLIATRRRR